MTWVESIIQPVLDVIAENVYPGVFLAALLETIVPPIPSEVVFPLAGYAILDAGMSWLHIPAVGVTGGAGATLGAYAIFLAARYIGRPGLLRYMGKIRISEKRMAKAERWFARYGDKSVLLGRCVPGVRELVSVPAGILDMGTAKFLAYTFVGSCAWSTGLTAAGYYLGRAVL
ncbi:MAG: DedA family protein [Thaumarchaeota archaeon]|nr:DedA family protein [Nitrososphaerota archaeon]